MANLLIQPAPVPSISKSMQNALAMKSMQLQTELAQRKLQDYPEDREWIKHLREFRTSLEPLAKVEALDKILRLLSKKMTLSNHDQVTENAYNQLGMDQSMTQGRVSAAQIAEEARAAGQDPETYYQNVYKPKSLMTWDQQFELIKQDLKEDKPTPRRVGETRRIQKGGELVTEEWDGAKWKEIGRGPKFKKTEPTPRKVGETRKIQKGENVVTEEWDGKNWTEIGKGPKFKETTERLYPTEEGYQRRKGAIGLKKAEIQEISATEKRATAKDVLRAEITIKKDPEDEATARPAMDLFNRYAEKPYVYIWQLKEIDWGRDKEMAIKIPLPKVNGKQVLARHVWEIADEKQITIEEVLETVLATNE